MKKLIAFPAPKVPTTNPAEKKALADVLDDLTYACVIEVADRAGVPAPELLRHMVREWYNVQFDVPAGCLKREMARSTQVAAAWGA